MRNHFKWLESHLKGKAIHKQSVRTETKMYLLMCGERTPCGCDFTDRSSPGTSLLPLCQLNRGCDPGCCESWSSLLVSRSPAWVTLMLVLLRPRWALALGGFCRFFWVVWWVAQLGQKAGFWVWEKGCGVLCSMLSGPWRWGGDALWWWWSWWCGGFDH